MKIPRYNIEIEVIGNIIDRKLDLEIAKTIVHPILDIMTRYYLSHVYIAYDGSEDCFLRCCYDCGYDEEQFFFLEANLTQKEIQYLDSFDYL